jgi:hypothetical protein
MISTVDVKKGVFATDGSRWGDVNGDPDGDGEVKLNWLDDGSKSKYTQAKTLTTVGDKGLIEHAEHVFGGVVALCSGLPGTSIQRLNLSGIGLTPDGNTRRATLFTSDTPFTAAIISLNVMKNPVGDDGLAALMTAIKGTNIKTITGITEGQTSIDYSDQGLTPMDLKTLAADIGFTPFSAAISSVNVMKNPIGDEGIQVLSRALKSTGIKDLNLADIGMTVAGLTFLAADISEMVALNKVTISSTGSKLSGRRGSGPVTYTLEGLQGGADPNLDLSSKNLGPADLQFVSVVFTSFSKFSATLSEVDLSGANIKESDLVALRSAAPDVSFVH